MYFLDILCFILWFVIWLLLHRTWAVVALMLLLLCVFIRFKKKRKKKKDIRIFRCEIYRLWKVNDTWLSRYNYLRSFVKSGSLQLPTNTQFSGDIDEWTKEIKKLHEQIRAHIEKDCCIRIFFHFGVWALLTWQEFTWLLLGIPKSGWTYPCQNCFCVNSKTRKGFIRLKSVRWAPRGYVIIDPNTCPESTSRS